MGGRQRDLLHPSAQVHQYQRYLQDSHTAFYEPPAPIELASCAYLHNYTADDGDVLFAVRFRPILNTSPVFTADDVEPLQAFLLERLREGRGAPVLWRVADGSELPRILRCLRHRDSYSLNQLNTTELIYCRRATQAGSLVRDRCGARIDRDEPTPGRSLTVGRTPRRRRSSLIDRKRLIGFAVVVTCATLSGGVCFATSTHIKASPEQKVAGEGAGDSCATFGKFKKAEDEAQKAAYDNALAKCSVTDAQCDTACSDRGYSGAERSLVDKSYSETTYTRGESCGWHAETHAIGYCGCTCVSPLTP